MADVVVFLSVWSSKTMSISIKSIRYITDQRVCLKINGSLFGEGANTGSLAGTSQYLLKQNISAICCANLQMTPSSNELSISNFFISIINLTVSRGSEVENICCAPEFPPELQSGAAV